MKLPKALLQSILEELLRMLYPVCLTIFSINDGKWHPAFDAPHLSSFMESPEGQDIYSYLSEIDTNFHEPHSPILDRSILISVVFFPFYKSALKVGI